jgi:hypothetical protein
MVINGFNSWMVKDTMFWSSIVKTKLRTKVDFLRF